MENNNNQTTTSLSGKKKLRLLVQKITADELVHKVSLLVAKKIVDIDERLRDLEIAVSMKTEELTIEEVRTCIDRIHARTEVFRSTLRREI